jgi:hypothetical protein
MMLSPEQYKFSPADTVAIEALGYVINNNSNKKKDFADFMETAYPNFDLLKLLQVVEQVLYPTTTLQIVKEIKFDISSDELVLYLRNQYRDEAEALIFKRTFYKEANEITVIHDYFVLPSLYQKQGLAKPVFQQSLQQYINIGTSKILVHAGLSGGGYTWAKHGFTITRRDEVDRILTKARQTLFPAELQFVERIYDHYYNSPDPVAAHKAFPVSLWAGMPFMKKVLMGSDWHGELNLKNPDQMLNFTNYVFRS